MLLKAAALLCAAFRARHAKWEEGLMHELMLRGLSLNASTSRLPPDIRHSIRIINDGRNCPWMPMGEQMLFRHFGNYLKAGASAPNLYIDYYHREVVSTLHELGTLDLQEDEGERGRLLASPELYRAIALAGQLAGLRDGSILVNEIMKRQANHDIASGPGSSLQVVRCQQLVKLGRDIFPHHVPLSALRRLAAFRPSRMRKQAATELCALFANAEDCRLLYIGALLTVSMRSEQEQSPVVDAYLQKCYARHFPSKAETFRAIGAFEQYVLRWPSAA